VQDQDGLAKRQQLAAELYLAAQSGRAGRIVAAASDSGSDRDESLEILELVWLRLHGELHATVPLGDVRDTAASRLVPALRSVREAQQAIRRYTSAPLALERLLRQLHLALWAKGQKVGPPRDSAASRSP
jgi:hypothetical protein